MKWTLVALAVAAAQILSLSFSSRVEASKLYIRLVVPDSIQVGDRFRIGVEVLGAHKQPLLVSSSENGDAVRIEAGRLLRINAKNPNAETLLFSVPATATKPGTAIVTVSVQGYQCWHQWCSTVTTKTPDARHGASVVSYPSRESEGSPNNASVHVLVVDDEQSNLEPLRKILLRDGYQVSTAINAKDALATCRSRNVHVLITDLMMPTMDGIELLRTIKTASSQTVVIVMTAFGTVETAVRAMREGAYDFIEKPLKRARIQRTVAKAAERHLLVSENQALRDELSALREAPLVGSAPPFRRMLDTARQAATSTATIMILGESGTGKELVARDIHQTSGRSGEFVPVNLAALPETIVEAELFGYEKGAFTDAVKSRRGTIARAEGGTLFLDEIGELSQQVQVKLLRVLQDGEYEPLGGTTRKADFRLLVATHRDLREGISTGVFREDLFYRLNVVSVTCPPLRDRPEDISLLAQHFSQKYASKNAKPSPTITKRALDALANYRWPGNVRELENAIERAVVLNRSGILDLEDLPKHIVESERDSLGALRFQIGTPLEEIERSVIEATLSHTNGDKQLAAELLGISARTIYRKVR